MLRFDRVTTPRLVLRRWQPGDLDSFAALNSDPEVMRHFPSTYDRSATAAMITAWEAKIDRQGFGLWAVERAEDGALLGMAGLNPVPPGIITGEGLEIGWRLAGTPGDTVTQPRPAEPPWTSPAESGPSQSGHSPRSATNARRP
jgi:RimJ/RimL family protein N-acetyltransferase